MENDLLIHEFLDGSLSAAEEENLFSLLAGENELRNEFKQQLTLIGAIKSDHKAFTPKAESTLQIFDKLGLALPLVALPTAAPVVSLGSKITTFLSVHSGYILSGLLSAVATLAIVFLLFDFGSNTTNLNQISNVTGNENNKQNTTQNTSQNDDIAALNKKIEDIDSKNAKIPEKIVYKYIYVNKTSDDNETGTDAIQKKEVILDKSLQQSYSNINNSVINLNNFGIDNGLFRNRDHSIVSPWPEQSYFGSNLNTGNFRIEFRGSDYLNNKYQGVKANENFNLVNTGLSLFYKLNNELSIGIDYRRETFAQEFTGEENDNYFLYRQEPNFQTFSLVAKYNPMFLNWERLSPYIYLGLGANSSGPVGRIMVGSDLYLSGNYYLTFGADYNTLIYSQSGSYFLSPKIGFHFGAGVNF